MNPWSFYEHQPQLVQSCVVGAVAWTAARAAKARRHAPGVWVWAAAAWAALGVLDFLVYAFGYQLAGLSMQETEPIQTGIGWLQVLPLLAGAIYFLREARTRAALGG
jgi:hypothetical protein